jgi:glycosyltransferase involved in cell wall biosynthesis
MRLKEPDAKVTRVLIVAPIPPPYGGMALQAVLLGRMLQRDGVSADVLGYNQNFVPRFRKLEHVPALRTFLRAAVFCLRFWRRSGSCQVVHILASSWLYFFLIVAPAIVIGKFRGKRVILNYRGGDADRFLRRCGWLARPWFRMADVITTPSEFLARVIGTRLGMVVSIVPNIVNFSIFRYRERRPFRPRMLVTRHLEKLYDVETVLRAFRQIQTSYPEASLWIAGTGSEEAHLRTLAENWNLSNVEFLGYVDHQGLPDVYDQCDILLNASRVDNFPGSLLEASAAGLVVVSTKAGGIPFLYRDGENSLLVEIGDWQALASAVHRLLANQPLARDLASAGRQLCQQCDWANVRRSLYAAYGFVPPEVKAHGSWEVVRA